MYRGIAAARVGPRDPETTSFSAPETRLDVEPTSGTSMSFAQAGGHLTVSGEEYFSLSNKALSFSRLLQGHRGHLKRSPCPQEAHTLGAHRPELESEAVRQCLIVSCRYTEARVSSVGWRSAPSLADLVLGFLEWYHHASSQGLGIFKVFRVVLT